MSEENAKASTILHFMLNSIRTGGPEDPIELEDVVALVGGTTLPIQRALKDGIEALEAREKAVPPRPVPCEAFDPTKAEDVPPVPFGEK